MLYEFLKNNYKEAEPIFFSDIVIKGITKSAVNQQLKKLCNEGNQQLKSCAMKENYKNMRTAFIICLRNHD